MALLISFFLGLDKASCAQTVDENLGHGAETMDNAQTRCPVTTMNGSDIEIGVEEDAMTIASNMTCSTLTVEDSEGVDAKSVEKFTTDNSATLMAADTAITCHRDKL